MIGPGATVEFRTALADALGPGAVSDDLERRREASRDEAWMSPILSRRLPEAVADVVVEPRDRAGVVNAVALAHRHRVPVTPRGKGTGNYGQSVPLHGGMVLDLSRRTSIVDVTDGWITAESGTSFVKLEAAARRTGQELAIFPSTTGSSLGGFLAGGAGGTGSIENGFCWEGFVDRIEVVPCTDRPEPFHAEGDDAQPYLHAYGTTGIVTEATVRLVPAREWTAMYSSFPTYEEAIAAARRLLGLDPLPRNLCVDDPDVVSCFPSDTAMPAGQWSLRAILDESTLTAAKDAVDSAGTVTAVRPEGTSQLVSLSYNHVTLRAKRARPNVCHVQAGGDELIARAGDVRALFPNGMIHHDANGAGRTVGFGGLVISDFVDDERLFQAMDELRSWEIRVVDPHTWMVGSHGDVESMTRVAIQNDPAGLLNPGKLVRPLPVG